ncbi:MAG: prepilin-type N-terminal cleavage/methylation domain-containing protein [Candidatus Omnitrophica bacterium]|nr:prepilin-type N-terminal cleavage/methylation domain-containing protein [Candidatus Omnitrophota bacterium]
MSITFAKRDFSTGRSGPTSGFTLIEIVIAAAIGAVVTWGTMAAFVAAARMSRAHDNPGFSEANLYAQQTVERFRNLIACGSPWFDPVTCQPSAALPIAWTTHVLPAGGGTESILHTPARRCYRVTPQDCDGVGGAGDCFSMEARVCWKDLTGCPCPP